MHERRRFGGALLALALTPTLALAQAKGTIVGRVIDAGSQEPVPSAQIAITHTVMGGVTDVRGRFHIPGVPAGPVTLHVVRIGYAPIDRAVTVPANDSVSVEISLTAVSLKLDQIVVTGTTGPQERRAQPAVVASLDVGDLTQQVPVTSVADVLQSRVPGVDLEKSSGTAGTSQTIRMRGISSISLSNEPLVFIDGIRVSSGNITSGHGSNGVGTAGGCSGCDLGGQATSLLDMINPDEIERIEVVKGPAAATLYGADASAGVIQIITKRGQLNSGAFKQTLTLQAATVDPNYAPPNNYGACTSALVAETSANPLCRGQEVGTIVHDNPLASANVFTNGALGSVNWTGHGGGENYGYFAAAHLSRENGTMPANHVNDKDARFNFHFQPNPKVVIDAGYGLIWTTTQLPDQGNNPYGFGGALIASPLTEGGPNNGWDGPYRDAAAIAAINNTIDVSRNTPSMDLSYSPTAWFTNRITLGADITHTDALRLVPRNDLGSYFGLDNTGNVKQTRYAYSIYTLNYLGDIKSSFFMPNWSSDLSFGMQLISENDETVYADGIGLASNTAYAISSAATRTGGQFINDTRSVGWLAQWQLAYGNKLFIQPGMRIDKNSGFGENVHTFFLPKIGVSYVISDESFWKNSLPWISTLRLRSSYGTTGRAPTAGAALSTYGPCPGIVSGSEVSGLCLLNPGNPDLRPEKGTEIEGGADLGFFNDRFGAEVTYFRKTTTDLLQQQPLPPSDGYSQNPFVNVGKVLNDGWEVGLRAQLVDKRSLSWTGNLSFSTLHNELVSLGDIAPFGTTQRFAPGVPLGGWWGYKIQSLDVADHKAIVGDTMQFLGNLLPTFEGNVSTTIGFFHNAVRLYGQVDWKTGYKVQNSTQSFRDRSTSVSLAAVDTTALSPAERLKYFGPYVTETGTVLQPSQVADPYIQNGDELRLREVSLTFALPARWLTHTGASDATLTFSGENLHLWTKYLGPDPEIHQNVVTTQFDQSDFLTFPPTRTYTVKLSLGF